MQSTANDVPQSCLLRHQLVCAPVTALAHLSSDVVLVGRARSIELYETNAVAVVHKQHLQIFKLHRIHCFVIHPFSDDADRSIIVIGGKEIAILHYSAQTCVMR